MFKAKNKSISSKIIYSIVLITFLSSIIVGLAGIISVSVINNIFGQVYNENMLPLTNIYKAEQDFMSLRVNLRNEALFTANANTYESQNQALLNDLNSQVQLYQKFISSAEETNNFEILKTNLDQFERDLDTATNKLNDGQTAAALSLIKGEMSDISNKVNSCITNAFIINNTQGQQRVQTSMVLFICILAVMIAAIVIFILIAIRYGKKTALEITKPIEQLVIAAKSIAKGNLNVDLDIQSEDETKTLAEEFNTVTNSLQNMTKDVNYLISEAVEGKLDSRADASRHEGDYRIIIEGINKMLDTVKAPLDVASAFINQLADGEHQEDIENIYKGYYAVLTGDLNKVRHSINILVKESTKLAEAGINGDLEVRGNLSGLNGAYAQIIGGVNKTFDAFKAPLDAASEFIQDLAEGTAVTLMENNYKGYYANLINNLNAVLSSLLILLSESQRLSEAGQNGNLKVRADISQLHGGYATIVEGFNKTLDAVIEPLQEGSSVMSKISYNDLTQEMSEKYLGDFNEFAKSINMSRTRLLSVQDAIIRMGDGDLSRLEELKKIGKRSENDKIMPAMRNAYQTIQNLIDTANHLAISAYEGQLDARGNVDQFKGGYRQIIEGMNRTMEAVSAPIDESAQVLQQLAQGNLTVEMTGEYKGNYNLIKNGLNKTIDAFNELLSQIVVAGEQVAAGSKQVSDGSQALAQGATEQASTLEELTSSITEVSSQTRQNAVNATQANSLAAETKAEALLGTEKMGHMLDSMKEINESSANISKINKVIDDIAFQTNILALNAAVEAARAGQYGKGFAVVAEEVRNLAAKSSEAAKETTTLIESSIAKVENGTKIASETADTLAKISGSVQKVTDLVGNIAGASNEQATAIAQIDQGLSQVSSVVQTNSATAEESAASSEELTGQADTLMHMVSKFTLRGKETNKNLQQPSAAKASSHNVQIGLGGKY